MVSFAAWYVSRVKGGQREVGTKGTKVKPCNWGKGSTHAHTRTHQHTHHLNSGNITDQAVSHWVTRGHCFDVGVKI